MIRMMSGIIDINPIEKDIIEESSHDVVSNLSKKYYDIMSKSHKEWIDTQKGLFSNLKYDDADESMYRILTNKYDEHMNKPLAMFMDSLKKVAKYQLENDSEDRKRISTIKAFLNHHPGLGKQYSTKPIYDIGYEFSFSYIDTDKIKDIYDRLIEDILKGRDISKDNIAERIYKDYRNLSKLEDVVEDGLDPFISKSDSISIEDIIDKYDDIFKSRTKLMKENISKFNKSYTTIGVEHKAAIEAWRTKMKKIKDSGVDGGVAHAAYTRCMNNMTAINAVTQHLLDSCYTIMKATLRIIADSDKASEKLTKNVVKYITDLDLDRGWI